MFHDCLVFTSPKCVTHTINVGDSDWSLSFHFLVRRWRIHKWPVHTQFRGQLKKRSGREDKQLAVRVIRFRQGCSLSNYPFFFGTDKEMDDSDDVTIRTEEGLSLRESEMLLYWRVYK